MTTVLHRSRRRPTVVLAAAAVVALALTGCGSTDPDRPTASGGNTPAASAPAGGTAADGTAADGEVLVVGTDPTHPPHDFLDGSGANTGWEYDFMQAVGTELGRPVQYQNAAFAALIPGLSSGRYNAVLANMGISKERLDVVDMVTVFQGGQAFLGLDGKGLDFPTLDALCGFSIGTTTGSQQADLADTQTKKCVADGKEPVEVKLFGTGDEIILAVQAGRVDVYWTAEPIAQYYATQPDSVLAVVGRVPGTVGLSAIALPKGTPLTEEMHRAVQSLIDDGTYGKILEKWSLGNNAITRSEINPAPAN